MENINQEKWSKLIKSDKDAFILDVRTPQECALGILPNAKVLNFMDYDLFIKGLENLTKRNPILFIVEVEIEVAKLV